MPGPGDRREGAGAPTSGGSILGGVAPEPGRKPIDADHLATVAALYLQAERNGDRAPAKAVERGLRKLGTDLKQPTARSWILAARKRGFLPPVEGTVNG